MTDAEPLVAWIAGATGLVGRETLRELLEQGEIARVVAVVRRPTGLAHPRLDERSVDFETLEDALRGERADLAFSCLGTTIKQAGSRERFRRVDHDYVLAFARAARAAGARHFLSVSSLGASPRSLTFYGRVKGEVEEALTALDFPQLTLARPSLLLGERRETRIAESLATPFAKLLPGKLKGIEGERVARALVKLALSEGAGGRVVDSDELGRLGA